MSHFTIPTAAGLAELAAAQAANQIVPFTHIALGDGNGAPVNPAAGQLALVHEVGRYAISRVFTHPDHPTWFGFEVAVPESDGPWTVREVGLIGGRVPGLLMAVGSYPVTEKTSTADGAGRALIVRMYVAYADAAAVSLHVDPQAYATAQSVQQALAEHQASSDPHPQYLTKAEADAFYDSIGLAAQAITTDAARLSAHVAAPDPHPQYWNDARAAAALSNNWAEQFFFSSGM